MANCPNCGSFAPDGNRFCQNCGAPLQGGSQAVSTQPQDYQQPYPYEPYVQPVTPYATGGLIAWSIITLLLCTIPGIVALVKACGINKATTVEDQMARISSTKTWCTVGTVLGVLALIGNIIASMMG